ncbi:hypothetical protein QIH53_27435, partial [Klebsiella pneumoniae]|nr:hypothetical protein [Klebsiella pneumoniae]
RIALCAAVILAHALIIFSADPNYHIKSAEPSQFATLATEFIRISAMATFFTIAGYTAVASLRSRGPLEFARTRV